MSNGPRKLYIKTYGCQMNVYDSGRMADILAPLGYVSADEAESADVVILNTCHIREKAAEKVYSELGRIRQLKERRSAAGGRMIIGVAGCVAQAEGEEILRRAPVVDMVFGPQTYHRLPDLIARAVGEGGVVDTGFPVESKFEHLAPPAGQRALGRGVTAFLTIQEGCDKFCTFCVVPYTRGAETSRPVDRIEEEARRLADAGVREITLLGQNVNAYHGTTADGRTASLGNLLERLARIDGLDRLRYTTSHPRDMDDDLIAAHRDVPEVMPYLHLPLQSGSDRVLAAMNRRHTVADYMAAIDRVRSARPDLALSSDFIVGFPGESEKDFEQTLSAAAAVGYAQAYSFKYSPRPGTPAASMPGQVPDEAKAERLAELQRLLDGQQRSFNDTCIGRRMSVLLDRPGRRPGQLTGRSPYLQAVHIDAGGHAVGDLVDVVIDAAGPNSLGGHAIATAQRGAEPVLQRAGAAAGGPR